MTTTAQVVADFAALFEGKDEEVSITEMKKMLGEVYKVVTSSKKPLKKARKEIGEVEKPKKAPSAYNIFMKAQMEKLKREGSTLSGKEKMQLIAALWKDAKVFVSEDDIVPEEEIAPIDEIVTEIEIVPVDDDIVPVEVKKAPRGARKTKK